ncbi:MAG: histidine kinase [Pseudoxanthomonas suwonensis]|nr:histidine kinase [Pseudoxanthomonas suwonensis]
MTAAIALRSKLDRLPVELWVFGIWWLLAALADTHAVKALNLQGYAPITWAEAFAYGFSRYSPHFLLGFGFYLVMRRRPLTGRWPSPWHVGVAVLHVAVSAASLAALQLWVFTDIVYWRDFLDRAQPGYGQVLTIYLGAACINAVANLLLMYGFAYYRQALQRGHALGALQGALSRSRLQALRSQVNPHFLFNALNSVSEAMHQDVATADRMVVALSTLLRDRLASDGRQTRPLSEELLLVREYLTIEQMRLGERLRVSWQVAPEATSVDVPALGVQVLVENAIVHAISRRRLPGELNVLARTEGQRLLLEVDNTLALPMEATRAPGAGLGLAGLRERLRLIYGPDASLQTCRGDGRFHARLSLPLAPVAKVAA